MLTLEQALVRATSQLSAHPKLRTDALADAVLLLRHVLGVSRATLIAHPERTVDRAQQEQYQRLIERRLTFEPMQYILGTQEFFGLSLRVTPNVLIPRPETETLVEAVLERLPGRASSDQPLCLVDVGTGSGAIAIALAHTLAHLSVAAVDLSAAALQIAQENAVTHAVEQRIRFVQSDLLTELRGEALYDAIVSNPPYIADGEADTLHPQVAGHEPALALYGGPTGLEVYQRLIPQAAALLKPGGLLALEIGYDQRDAVAALLEGWTNVSFVPDLQHIARVACAERS